MADMSNNTCIYCGYRFNYRPQKAPLCNSKMHCSSECVSRGNACHLPTVLDNLEARMSEHNITPKELALRIGEVEDTRSGASVITNAVWVRRRLRRQVMYSVGDIGLMCVAADTTLKDMSSARQSRVMAR